MGMKLVWTVGAAALYALRVPMEHWCELVWVVWVVWGVVCATDLSCGVVSGGG